MIPQRKCLKLRHPGPRPRACLQVERLESRDLPSTFNLTPLVRVSGPDPFIACEPAGWPYANGEAEPQLAVDPTNSNHLVGVWNQAGHGMVAGVSFNSGNSWQEVMIPGMSVCSGGSWPFIGDPWVSIAANGDVYVSAQGTGADAVNKAVLVSKSTDGGLTWGTPTTIVTAKNDEVDKDSITADPTNSKFAYVTWTRPSGSNGTTMFSRTTDGGQTWEPDRKIFDSGSNNIDQAHQIVVLPDGTLVNFFSQLLFRNNAGGINHYDFKISSIRSSDHGQTWLPPNAAIPVADILPLTDSHDFTVANPDGGPGVRAPNFVFDVTVDPTSGNLYVVWQDARFSNFQYTSIAFAMSTDGGFTWSSPIRVNHTPDNIPVGNRQAFIPSVAVAADGTVAVTYYDLRKNSLAPGLLTDYWMVHAHANTDLTKPVNWASENRLTKDSFDIEQAGLLAGEFFVGDYEGLSAAGNNFGAFWSMPHKNPDGTIDIGSIYFRDPLPADPPANINTDTEGDIHNETTIAVNPTNPLNMIASANDYQGTDLHGSGQFSYTVLPRARVTFDGGQSWTSYPIPFNGYSFVADPSLSFDADGNAFFAAAAFVHSQNVLHSSEHYTAQDIIVSHSRDGGRTWSAPVRVAKGKGNDGEMPETDNDKPYVAAWGHGNAIVTWTQFNFGPKGKFVSGPVMASVTHDGGDTWTAPVQISGSVPSTFCAVPTIAADGSIYVAYMSYFQAAGLGLRDHYEVVKVDPATGQALGTPVDVGLIYDGVNDYPVGNFTGSQTYQDSQFRTFSSGNITADPTNALHLAVIWSDMRNSILPVPANPYQAKTNSDIIVSQSFDGGLHWSAPAAIATVNDQFMPWGAYDAGGRLHIGYYDRSYDPANHKYGYTLASETAPGSLGFTTEQVTTALSDPTQGDAFFAGTADTSFPSATTFMGDYSSIAVMPTGQVAALWTDMRLPAQGFPGSGEDAFFALVTTPAALTAAAAVSAQVSQTLSRQQIKPLLAEAQGRWQLAGIDVSALGGIDVRVTNLGGRTLGLASGNAIWLDDNAAGWGWFVDPTPYDDSEFHSPRNQGEPDRMDRLTVLIHEIGHLRGREHEKIGVMIDTLPVGTRRLPGNGIDAATRLDGRDFFIAFLDADEESAGIGSNLFGRGRH